MNTYFFFRTIFYKTNTLGFSPRTNLKMVFKKTRNITEVWRFFDFLTWQFLEIKLTQKKSILWNLIIVKSVHWNGGTNSLKKSRKCFKTLPVRKIMATLFWDSNGVSLIYFLKHDTTIKSEVLLHTDKVKPGIKKQASRKT